jgi:hypothetical protein
MPTVTCGTLHGAWKHHGVRLAALGRVAEQLLLDIQRVGCPDATRVIDSLCRAVSGRAKAGLKWKEYEADLLWDRPLSPHFAVAM